MKSERFNPNNIRGSLPKDENLNFNIEALRESFKHIEAEMAERAVGSLVDLNLDSVED